MILKTIFNKNPPPLRRGRPLSLLEPGTSAWAPWKGEPYGEQALPTLLGFEITHACLQQIAQRDHANQLARIMAGNDGQPREACLGHSVDDHAQRFVWIRHHRMRLHHLS